MDVSLVAVSPPTENREGIEVVARRELAAESDKLAFAGARTVHSDKEATAVLSDNQIPEADAVTADKNLEARKIFSGDFFQLSDSENAGFELLPALNLNMCQNPENEAWSAATLRENLMKTETITTVVRKCELRMENIIFSLKKLEGILATYDYDFCGNIEGLLQELRDSGFFPYATLIEEKLGGLKTNTLSNLSEIPEHVDAEHVTWLDNKKNCADFENFLCKLQESIRGDIKKSENIFEEFKQYLSMEVTASQQVWSANFQSLVDGCVEKLDSSLEFGRCLVFDISLLDHGLAEQPLSNTVLLFNSAKADVENLCLLEETQQALRKLKIETLQVYEENKYLRENLQKIHEASSRCLMRSDTTGFSFDTLSMSSSVGISDRLTLDEPSEEIQGSEQD